MTCLHTTTKPTKANLDPNGGNRQFSTLNHGELQLKQRKELTGSSIKEIGNSVLRTFIESVFLGDIVGRILVEKGKVSEDEYSHALKQASAELRQFQANVGVPVEMTRKGTLIAGS